MKRVIFFLLLAVSFSANSQSLKELLYSGKLKNDSNTVIRKTDDLSTKIDTSTKKKPEATQTKVVAAAPVVDTIKVTNPQTGEVTTTTVAVKDPVTTSNTTTAATETAIIAAPPVDAPPVAAPAAVPTKTTTKIWKEYTDSLVKVLHAEVMSNKKIK